MAMAYGHRTGYVADPMQDRFVELPDDLDPLLGIYVAHMGPICANGLLHAAADLHGPNVRAARRRRARAAGRGDGRGRGRAADGVVRPRVRRGGGRGRGRDPGRLAVAAALGANVLAADDDPAVS